MLPALLAGCGTAPIHTVADTTPAEPLLLNATAPLPARGRVAVPDAETRQNFLIIVADDLGVDKVGAYAADVDPDYAATALNLPLTPVLDDLAASGVRFRDAWANPSCSPTRASLLTGQVPARHGVGDPVGVGGTPPLSPDAQTYAQLAQLHDYSTGLFGKWHLGDGIPEDWSAEETWDDHVDEVLSVGFPPTLLGFSAFAGTVADLDLLDREGYYDWLRVTASRVEDPVTRPTGESVYATLQTTQDALDWIARQKRGWVATVSYHAPHTPFEAPPETCGYGALSAGERAPDPKLHRAMVECMDVEIGVLLDGIDELAHTTIVFLGDNGTEPRVAEGVFDDGRGKGTVYETGVRVPLIVADGADFLAWMGRADPHDAGHVVHPGRTSDALVHVQDLYATLADWIGAEPPGAHDSVSLQTLLADEPGPRRQVVTSERFTDTEGVMALRQGDAKLIVWGLRTDPGQPGCINDVSVHDLGTDRLEEVDLSGVDTALRDELLDALQQALADQPDPWLGTWGC